MTPLSVSIAMNEHWSSIGFWILAAGLIGDIAVIFIPKERGRLEKFLAILFTIVVIIGCAIEHWSDSANADLVKRAITPRAFNQADEEDLIAQLRKFAGQRIGILEYSSVPDADPFGTQLAVLLIAAGWNAPSGFVHAESRIVVGVLIELGPNSGPSDKLAAGALAKALNAKGIKAEYQGTLWPANLPRIGFSFNVPPPIYVTVGQKP